MWGRKHTAESIEKMINSHKGTKASAETREKMSMARKGEKHSGARVTIQLTKDGKFVKAWPMANAAAEALGINRTCINACARGERKTAGGYRWVYADTLTTEEYRDYVDECHAEYVRSITA
jgi:general stress protein YciG